MKLVNTPNKKETLRHKRRDEVMETAAVRVRTRWLRTHPHLEAGLREISLHTSGEAVAQGAGRRENTNSRPSRVHRYKTQIPLRKRNTGPRLRSSGWHQPKTEDKPPKGTSVER